MNDYSNLPDYSVPRLIEDGPPFEPRYLNVEYFFQKILDAVFGPAQRTGEISGGTYFLPELKIFLMVLTVFGIAVIAYAVIRVREIRQAENKAFHFAEPALHDGERTNEQWEVVQKHINSENPADWRLAILEADNMLEDMVQSLGYQGESLGEKLKAVEPSDFTTIQSAWEAHKVRNQIAHEGTKFVLTQREARRVVGLYKDVFDEFDYI